MVTLYDTYNAAELVAGINANLEEIGSDAEVSASMSATQLVGTLNEVFDGTDTQLSVDDNAEQLADKLNDNFEQYALTPKEQYLAEISDTIAKVNELDTSDALVFILCTDVHYDPTEWVTADTGFRVGLEKVFDDSAVNMKAVAEDTGIDFLFCLGDMIDGRTNDDGGTTKSRADAAHMISKLQSVGKPLYIALGNHDNNKNGKGVTAPSFSRDTMKTMFMDYISDGVTFAEYPNNKHYNSDYYRDFASQGIRLIVIYGNADSDSKSNYLFDETTRSFLQSSLANLPTGYKAIVMTHVPPITKMNYGENSNGTSRDGGENIPSGGTAPSIKDIILNAGDKAIAMFYGHCHQDNIWSYPFVSIGSCCNKGSFANGIPTSNSEDAYMPNRATDDETADLWDVVLVKPTAKRIDIVRFGAGVDRTIHYEPVECTAGSSTAALVPTKASGGNWCLRTSDNSKASVANGVVTVNAGVASGTLISVIYTDKDPTDRKTYQGEPTSVWDIDSGGNYMEYWTIKVINT